MTPHGFVGAVLACLTLAGCQDPYTDTERGNARLTGRDERPSATRTPAAQPRGDELAPSPRASESTPPYHAARARRGASATLEAFCGQWANWRWRSIGRQHRRLAELATGPLAEQLAAQARQAKLDQALRRDRLAMRGRVVAVDLQPRGRRGRAVCVTREQEIQNGRAELGGRHRVYLATLERTPKGWGVSRWEPQP